MNRNQAAFLTVPQAPAPGGHAVTPDDVCAWFADPGTVEHYVRATAAIGLWKAEQVVFTRVFARSDRLLDVGCGTGRIAIGLWRIGYSDVVGADFCTTMVERAREIAQALGSPFSFRDADARALPWADGAFDGAIFGFNGLMQIPGRAERRRALSELRRVVRPGGRLVFTTHDRELPGERALWEEERRRWDAGTQDPHLVEFGDRVFERPEGRIFMHLPDRAEILDELRATGWTHEADELRCRIANEPIAVREFADECRFWIARA